MKQIAKAAKSGLIIGIIVTPAWTFLSASPKSQFSTADSSFQRRMTATTSTVASWDDLVRHMDETPVGKALTNEVEIRKTGKGSAHVHNTLRTFDPDNNQDPQIILYRDHAGW